MPERSARRPHSLPASRTAGLPRCIPRPPLAAATPEVGMLFFTQCFGAVLDLIHLRFQHYKAKRVFSAAGQLVCVVNPTHSLKVSQRDLLSPHFSAPLPLSSLLLAFLPRGRAMLPPIARGERGDRHAAPAEGWMLTALQEHFGDERKESIPQPEWLWAATGPHIAKVSRSPMR